mmetsp:Transcript_15253/g.38297  ORF Transcript_15253/g.38297 Transcript_15253/m.38297 type:complete len:477 (+) Transcript_15253:52-1482(+)
MRDQPPTGTEGGRPRVGYRWLLCPALFVAAVFRLAIDPEPLLERAPALWPPPSADTGALRVVPPHPSSLHQAFRLGQLATQCSRWLGTCPQGALAEAAEVVGSGRKVTSAELLGVEALVRDLDAKRSYVNRLFGLLSFVNVVMFFSIVGIIATVGPAFAVVFGPFFRKYVFALVLFVSRRLLALLTPPYDFATKTLPPILHRWCVFEVSGYALSFLLVSTAAAYPPEHASMACMVAVAGGFSFVCCLFYSGKLHEPGFAEGFKGKERTVPFMVHMLTALALGPIAVVFQSQMIGFFAVLAFYQAVGFTVFSTFFGWRIGFEGREWLIRCAVSSKIILMVYAVLLTTHNADQKLVYPFGTAVQILGSVVYFLALLITSSFTLRRTPEQYGSYIRANCVMAASLVLYAFLGSVWNAPALSNTAITFFVLWVERFQIESSHYPVVSVFLVSCASAWSCHYLSTHPSFLLAMIQPEGVFA